MARAREFDPNDALERAVGVFWDKGYFDTSMDELVSAMGVARYGVYSTWGNKRDLFVAALKCYMNKRMTIADRFFGPADASLPEIFEFFAALGEHGAKDGHLGCMVCNAAIELAPHDKEVAALVRELFAQLATAFRRALDNAVANGDLDDRHDLDALSHYLAGVVRGVAVMPRAGYSDKAIQSHLKLALSVLN